MAKKAKKPAKRKATAKGKVSPAVKKAIKAQRAPAAKKASTKKKRGKVGRPRTATGDSFLLNFKIGKKEHVKVRALAKKFTNGNISAWARFAVVSAAPTRAVAKALAAA